MVNEKYAYNWITSKIGKAYLFASVLRRYVHRRQPRSLSPDVVLTEYGDSTHEYFFGYYDITPFSADERRVLAIQCPMGEARTTIDNPVEVGYFLVEGADQKFHRIGDTTNWCWQQGCRLQWYPTDGNRLVLYNQLVQGKHGAVIQDVETKRIEREYCKPIYSLSGDGRFAVSLNFARLQRLRPGYGYGDLPDETIDDPCPDRDGLWIMDMHTGNSEILLTMAEIARFQPQETMQEAVHYVNHVLWNPDSSRFMFFHLWLRDGIRRSRLLTLDKNGQHLFALYNEEHVSHYCWKNNDELVAFSTHLETGPHFHHYRDQEGLIGLIGQNVLTEDGHPSFNPSSNLLLTDTYPNRFLERELLLFNIDSCELEVLGTFYSPPVLAGELRCDLHPRWSPTGSMICFDSAHGGKRTVCILKLS